MRLQQMPAQHGCSNSSFACSSTQHTAHQQQINCSPTTTQQLSCADCVPTKP